MREFGSQDLAYGVRASRISMRDFFCRRVARVSEKHAANFLTRARSRVQSHWIYNRDVQKRISALHAPHGAHVVRMQIAANYITQTCPHFLSKTHCC